MSHDSCLNQVSCLMSPFSRLLFPVSCLLSQVSCPLSVSHLMFPVSRLLSHVSCFLSHISGLMYPVSVFSVSFSRLLYLSGYQTPLVSQHLPPVSQKLFHVHCLSHFSCLYNVFYLSHISVLCLKSTVCITYHVFLMSPVSSILSV